MADPLLLLHAPLQISPSVAPWLFACATFAVGVVGLLIMVGSRGRGRLPLPPGPPCLPWLGNLHQLLLVRPPLLPHHALARLSKKHGPLMCLRMGSRLALFLSSSAVAKRFFQANDRHFASRPAFQFCQRLLYGHQNGVAFSVYGPRWRKMRRVCTLELFTVKRIVEFQRIAEEELALLVDDIDLICRNSPHGSVEINVAHLAHLVVSNMMGRLVLSRRMCDTYGIIGNHSLLDMFKMVNDAIVPAITDFLPLCGPLLDCKARRNMHRVHQRVDAFWQAILDERRKHNQIDASSPPKDFLNVLLSNEEVSELGDDNIKATLMDILGAGSETSAITIEWVMAELLRNPDRFLMLQGEIDAACTTMSSLPVSSTSLLYPISASPWAQKNVLTSPSPSPANNESASSLSSMACPYVKCSDIAGTSYLKSVLKETLRLHPPVPLLIPRASTPGPAKCHFDGKFTFEGDMMLFVNAWAIGRDEENWESPNEFRPERFDGRVRSSMNWSDTNFQLLPFGAGRRKCPGMALSLCIMELTVATFVKAFHWELPNQQLPKDMDMSEKSGSAGTHKAVPLLATLRPRMALR